MQQINNDNPIKQSMCGSIVAPAQTILALNDKITPFPEDLAPGYLLAQQAYKNELKHKFRLFLAIGKETINIGVGEQQFGHLDPMNEAELDNVTTQLESHSTPRQRRELVDALIPGQASDDLSSLHADQQYVRSVKMLNQLVAVLAGESKKFDTYEELYVNDDKPSNSQASLFTQEQLLSGMLDMITVLPMFSDIKSKVTNNITAQKVVEDSHFSLFGQMNKFLDEKQGTIDDRTIVKYKASFALLKELFPEDSDIRDWKKQRVQDVKAMLIKRKSNQNKNCKEESLMSVTTRNMYLSNYRTFFKWAINNTDAEMNNPFANSAFPKPKGKSKGPKRRSFTHEEVRKLLHYRPLHGSEAKDFRSDAKWYLKVCIYSSMRLNELSALPLSNIKQIDGIWCFDLRGLNLKNEASERVIPIAQFLLDEGILDYVEVLKKQNETYFCPQIRYGKTKPSSAGWGDPISRWFNRSVLKNIGINKGEELKKGRLICFHCTRRTFISACISNSEEHYLVKRLAGHSVDDDITLSVYADVDEIDLKQLKDVIDRNLKWHESDLH